MLAAEPVGTAAAARRGVDLEGTAPGAGAAGDFCVGNNLLKVLLIPRLAFGFAGATATATGAGAGA